MKNLLKGTCLVVALMVTFAMVGCGGGGGSSKKSSTPVTNVAVNIPLPAPAANMRANVRASYSKETFKAYYYNADALVTPYDYLFDDASATVIFAMVPTIDMVVKSELNKGDGFKPYYQGLISKAKINGSNIKQKLTPETTAKAMLFEAKAEKDTNLSIENFEYTMEQEKAKGNDVWDILGVTSADMEKSLTDLTVKEDVESKAKTAADSLEIEEKPAPQPEPTPDTSTITSEKLDAITDWREVDESVITELVTVDNNKAAKMLYRGTRNAQGTKWADMQANGKKRYFVEAKMPATPHHFFVFENNSVLLTISAFTDGEGKTTFTYSGMTEKESIGGTVIAYTATLDNKTYIKLVDIVEVKADDAEGIAYDYYLEATDLPEDLAQEIEKQRYPDAIIKELAAKKDGWEKTDEKEDIRKYLTTGGSYSIIVNEDPLEFENITDEPDGGKAALLCYSSTDGVSWVAPIDTLVTYDAGSGSHPYSLYKDNKWDDSYEFMYDKANDIFTSNNYVYGGVITRSYKIEKTTYKDVVYYRATNTNEEQKDVYIFKMIERPNDLIKAVDAPEN